MVRGHSHSDREPAASAEDSRAVSRSHLRLRRAGARTDRPRSWLRWLLASSLAATSLAASTDARAFGAFLIDPPAAGKVTELRTALASEPTGQSSTRWVQFSVQSAGSGTAFAWVVPLAEGAVIDLVSPTFLDALEDATAPRIRPPGTPPDGATCSLSKEAETVSNGPTPPVEYPHDIVFAPTLADVEKQLDEWGFVDQKVVAPASPAAPVSYVVLQFVSPRTALSTVPLRIVEPTGPRFDQSMTHARATLPLPTTTFLLGEKRARILGATLQTIEPSRVSWRDSTRTTYLDVRDSQLAGQRFGFVVENADPGAIVTTKLIPPSTNVPSLLDAYLSRARDRAEATFGYDEARAQIVAAISGMFQPTPCPRGDVAGKPSCEVLSPEDDPRVLGAQADDLSFGLQNTKVVTRIAGVIGANELGLAGDVSFEGSPGAADDPVIREPTPVWSLVCTGLPGTTPGGTGSGGAGPGSGNTGSGGGEGRYGDADDGTRDVVSEQPTTNVTVLCDGSSRGAAASDMCSSSDEATGDSCSSDDGNSDSCSSSDDSDSCSNSDGSDSCDSGGDSGGDSCSNADGSAPSCSGGSTGGDSCGNCAVGVGGKRSRRIRLSPLGLGVACLAFVVRRRTRPRR
jgi:hypothetical protein